MSDSNYQNVVLLLPMEGVNNSTAFVDCSPSPKQVIAYGGAKISTAQSKWGNGSGYFDGTAWCLLDIGNAPLRFGTGDFTLEFWIDLQAAVTTYPQIVSTSVYSANGGFYLYADGASTGWGGTGKLSFAGSAESNGASLTSTSNVRGQGWKHIAITRSGAAHRLFVNGTLEASANAANANYTGISGYIAVPTEANGAASPTYREKCYLQDFRVTLGVARYTADFTPPGRLVIPNNLVADGPWQTINGTAIVAGNGGASQVVIRDWASRRLAATAVPDPSTGVWTASIPPGVYDITYFADGCQPICHGPYTFDV